MLSDHSPKNWKPEPEAAFLDTMQAARLLGISASHLEKLRHYRKPGPPFVRIGRAVRYPESDLRAWATARMEAGQ